MTDRKFWIIAIGSMALTLFVTWPVALHPASTVYTPLDHISTDMYSVMAICLWYPSLGQFAATNMLCAPFSQPTFPVHILGWVISPITCAFGPIFSHNLLTIFGLFSSALAAYALAMRLTKNRAASILSGISFGFCPYMLLRAYTTYDTIQVAWIPLFVLSLLHLSTHWRTVIPVTLTLFCATFLSHPYYAVFSPVLAGAYLITHGARHWKKIALAFAITAAIGVAHFEINFQGRNPVPAKTTVDQQALRLIPADYIIPPEQTFALGAQTKPYWDNAYRTEGRVSINCAAYLGVVAMSLATIGAWRKRKDRTVRFLIATGAIAFVVTLGPDYLLSEALLAVAPFARRVSAYKVFVQFSVAILAAIGLASMRRRPALAISLCALAFIETATVPPFHTANITRQIPPAYEWLRGQPGDGIVLEYPMFKANKQDYQGYTFYQMFHGKRLFNSGGGWIQGVPPNMRGFWEKMANDPAALISPANLDTLYALGVRYIVRHPFVATRTANFPSTPQLKKMPPRLRPVLPLPDRDPDTNYPHDYWFSEVYAL